MHGRHAVVGKPVTIVLNDRRRLAAASTQCTLARVVAEGGAWLVPAARRLLGATRVGGIAGVHREPARVRGIVPVAHARGSEGTEGIAPTLEGAVAFDGSAPAGGAVAEVLRHAAGLGVRDPGWEREQEGEQAEAVEAAHVEAPS